MKQQTKKPPTGRISPPSIKEIFIILFCILVAAPLIVFGPLVVIFDGFCAGGSFCSRPPGFLSLIGSAMLALGIQLIFIAIKENIFKREIKLRDWRLFLIITIGVFLLRIATYYLHM